MICLIIETVSYWSQQAISIILPFTTDCSQCNNTHELPYSKPFSWAAAFNYHYDLNSFKTNRTEPRAELQINELKNSNESNITNKWPTTTTKSSKNSFSITINKCKFFINIYAKCLIPYFIFEIHYARSILLCVRASEIAFHFNKHFCLRKFMNFVHMLKICTQSKFRNWI